MASVPFLRRVRLKNYKSIGDCDVELGRFTILVGRNGSGKSNFLDALAFVSDALNTTVREAAEKRHGMHSVVHRAALAEPGSIVIALEFGWEDGTLAEYLLEVGSDGGHAILRRERFLVTEPGGGHRTVIDCPEVAEHDDEGLARAERPLNLASETECEAASAVLNALRDYRVYDPQPRLMRGRESRDGKILAEDGSNASAVYRRLPEEDSERLVEFLSVAVDDFGTLSIRSNSSNEEWVGFYYTHEDDVFTFHNHEVSDGTLREFAVLLASRQLKDGRPLPLVAIEEPDAGLHPRAGAAIFEALQEASLSSQILITSHSPDLLELLDPDVDCLLVAERTGRSTRIGPVDEVSRSVIREKMYSADELLRQDQLAPEREAGGV